MTKIIISRFSSRLALDITRLDCRNPADWRSVASCTDAIYVLKTRDTESLFNCSMLRPVNEPRKPCYQLP